MRRRTDPRGMRSHQAVAACALIVSLAACSEATAPVIPTPTTVVPAVDSVAFTALGQIQVVTATVLDQFGVGMVGQQVQGMSLCGGLPAQRLAGLYAIE